MVAAGRSFMSSFKSRSVFSSTFGILPGLFFGAREPSLPAVLT